MTAKRVIAPLRKRLMDLYTVGKLVDFEDESGEFKLWVQRIDDGQEREAMAKSKIARVQYMAMKRDKDHEDRKIYEDLLMEWNLDSREAQIEFLISPRVAKAEESNASQIASEKEWSDDDYLAGLQEAWNDEFSRTYAEDPEDVGAKRVHDELRRYTNQVDEAVAADADEYRYEYEDKDATQILNLVVDLLIEAEADAAQMAEFRKWQLYFAARDPEDHEVLVFESRDDLDRVDKEIYKTLLEAYLEMAIEGVEGKD